MLLIAKYISMQGGTSTRLHSSIGNQLFSQMPAREAKRNEPTVQPVQISATFACVAIQTRLYFPRLLRQAARRSDSMTRHFVQFRTSPELNSLFPPWDIPYPG